MMRRSLVLALAGIGMSSFGAMAADMPMSAPSTVSSLYNWTGFYVGGNAGYAWGSTNDVGTGVSDPAGGLAIPLAAGVIPLTFLPDPKGALGGAQIGFNYQPMPNSLVGAEADFSFADMQGSQTINTAVPAFFPVSASVSQKLDWFGTIRGRIGIPVENWLFYGTGGGAYGHVKYSYTQSNAPLGPVNFSGTDSATQWGWTIGAGVEYGWGRWVLRAEYLYFDLGHHSFTVPLNTVPTTSFAPNFSNKYSIARAALNYRFP